MQTQNYQALLYYGIEENETECTVFHAFRAVDPKLPHDDSKIAAELAAQLDCSPEDDCFQSRSMYIDLPESLIRRIQHDAIVKVIEMGAEEFIRTNPAFATQIYSVMQLQGRELAQGTVLCYIKATTDGTGKTTRYGYHLQTGVLKWVQYPCSTGDGSVC